MPDNTGRFRTREIAVGRGKLRTADDPATIGPEDVSDCTNMRPSDQYHRGIGGMTKINTSALSSTGIRNMYHFRKSLPVESHVLAWTNDGKVWVNDTAIPNQGAFDAAALFTDTAGGSTGRFSNAPNGGLLYANGKEACLWGGDEHRCAGFIDFPVTGQTYDYGDLITNTRTDDNNVATIHAVTAAADSDVVALFHFDTNFEDSTANDHDATAVGNSVISTTKSKFGPASPLFDGNGDYLTITNHPDFNFSATGSDGKFCIDVFCGGSGTSRIPFGTFYSHAKAGSGTDYIRFYRDSSSGELRFEVWIGSSMVVNITHPFFFSSSGSFAFTHLMINGNKSGPDYNYYMFWNGTLLGSVTHTAPPTLCTRDICIGAWDNGSSISDVIGSGSSAYLDELRISKVSRQTASYSPPNSAYGSTYVSTTYIGSIMPLDGAKPTVVTANTQISTMSMAEWTDSGWSNLTITDNTSSGGKTLAQTGTVTWASTATTSIPTVVEKVYLYWYKMVITSAADFSGVTISTVTVSIPFQAIKDIWDGEERPCNSFIVYDSPKYLDYTTNVLENGFSSTGSDVDKSTYAKLASLTTTDHLYAGFIERMAGIAIYVIDEYGNTKSITLSWSRWNGSAWTPLNATDGTMDGSKPLAKSGWITWPPADRASEFKRSDIGVGSNRITLPGTGTVSNIFSKLITPKTPAGASQLKTTGPLYYYRASFSDAIDPDVRIYHVAGIPAPREIRGYSFPMFHQNRPVLVSNSDGAKNTVLMGATDTANVFNGLDAYEFPFGQDAEINAATSLFLRFGSAVQDIMVLTKQSEIHLLEGNGSDSDPYRVRLLSSAVGCRAPLTMATVPVGDLGGGLRRQIAVWESQRGIEVFDGSALLDPLISHDIRDKFDPNHANYAGSSANTGFYDAVYDEYHWCPVGSAEWVFSFKYKKWYQVVRGTGKYLYGGTPAMDTSGNSYIYGFNTAGNVFRLENGTDFDGNDIAHTIKTGAIALNENRISEETTLRMVKVVQVAKNTTANSMTVTHYGDTDPTGNSIGTINLAATANKSGVGRLRSAILNAGSKGSHVHHEFQLSLTTDDEVCGCEPIYIVAYYDGERQDVR